VITEENSGGIRKIPQQVNMSMGKRIKGREKRRTGGPAEYGIRLKENKETMKKKAIT